MGTLFVMVIFLGALAGDGWLIYYFFKEILSDFAKEPSIEMMFFCMFLCMPIAFVATLATIWLGYFSSWSVAVDSFVNGGPYVPDFYDFAFSGKGFIYSCKISLITPVLAATILISVEVYNKFCNCNLDDFKKFLLRLILIDLTTSVCINAFINSSLMVLLKTFGIVILFSLIFVVGYPWLAEFREYMINKKTIKKIETQKRIIKSTSRKINTYTANYLFADKVVDLFGVLDTSESQKLLIETKEKAKKRDYNQLCISVRKQWKKSKLKKIFNDKFIENKAVVYMLGILKECDNSNNTAILIKNYEKLKKNAEFSRVPQLPRKINVKKQLDISSIVNFNNAITNEIKNKDRDNTMLKNKDFFEGIAERYLHLKKKSIIFNTTLILLCLVGLAYNVLIWKGMF